MLEKILPYEEKLFFLINSSHSPFWDKVMWLYSGIYVWIPFVIFFFFMLIYKKEKKTWLPVIVSLLLVAIFCIIFSSLITKPYFARLRPIYYPSIMDQVRTLYEGMLEPYGFISGHSAISFGIATFTSLLFRQKLYSWIVYFWALTMAYSRIYLGVHFISDIFGGALAGLLIGYIVYRLYRSYITKKNTATDYVTYSRKRIRVLAWVLICYIAFFTLTSSILIKFLG